MCAVENWSTSVLTKIFVVIKYEREVIVGGSYKKLYGNLVGKWKFIVRLTTLLVGEDNVIQRGTTTNAMFRRAHTKEDNMA